MSVPCDVEKISLPGGRDPVVAIAHALKECLCEGARQMGYPLCACCLFHGERITADVCDCECTALDDNGKPVNGKGQGWVRTVSSQMIVPVVQTAGRARSQCRPGGQWLITFEVGVARCIRSVGEEPPSCADREADAHQALADEWLLRWVVDCCPRLKGLDVQTAVILPWGPQGGCAGSSAQIGIAISATTAAKFE